MIDMDKKIIFKGQELIDNGYYKYYLKNNKVFRFKVGAGSKSSNGNSSRKHRFVVKDSKKEITMKMYKKYYCGGVGCSKSLADALKPYFEVYESPKGKVMVWDKVKNRKMAFDAGKEMAGQAIIDFIESKQPKGLTCSCICGHIKWMVDKKELESFVRKL